MARIELRSFIKAPLEYVFDYVVNPANRPEWMDSVIEVKSISGGPIGVGTSWTESQKLIGKLIEYVAKITEFERSRRWAMEMSMLGTESILENTFEPENDGTRMTLVLDYALPGSFLGQFADKLLMERRMAKTCRQNTATLKMVLESGQGKT